MKKPSENVSNNSQEDQEKKALYVIETYKHINDMYKFFINLRFIILAASLGALSFIITNFSNNTSPISNYRRIFIFLGIGTSIIFYLMDRRTRMLFKELRAAGKDLEENEMHVVGVYTYATKMEESKAKGVNRLPAYFSHSRIISISYLFILVLFLYLLVLSYRT